MRKRTVLSMVSLLVAIFTGLATAQQAPTQTRQYYASDYNYSILSQQANVYTFFPYGTCLQVGTGGQFFPFATNAPIRLVDATAANSETVTPSAIIQTSSNCGVTISPGNQHFSFKIVSATGGLQEALNQFSSSLAQPVPLFLDRNWYQNISGVSGTASSVINSAAGSSGVYLVDMTQNPWAYYTWNGTKYIATSGNVGGAATPAVAATAGSGTGPTITAFGNGSVIWVNDTTGTSTATGTIFTLTFANTPASFGYAPVCTITNVGSTVPAGTLSVAAPFASSHVTLTASIATTALVASTAYQFKVVCN